MGRRHILLLGVINVGLLISHNLSIFNFLDIMIKKIVSCGQTGADQAALDAAIKLDIPHGGWIPKGRITENGPLPDKYQLDEMPTPSYEERTEQNVVDSDGTLIVSHGKLTGGSKLTRELAMENGKYCLHINLNKSSQFDAAVKINKWVSEKHIEVLNVAGPRASKDSKIYKAVMDILVSVCYLDLTGDNVSDVIEVAPQTVSEVVEQIISDTPLKDRATVANMAEEDVQILESTLGLYIEMKLDEWATNERLLDSCREATDDENLKESDAVGVIIKDLWRKLRETHKLRIVS